MQALERGGLRARLAEGPADMACIRALRARAFPGAEPDDPMDARCLQVLVEGPDKALLACFRVMVLPSGAGIGDSYSAGFYDLAALSELPGPMVEMGRFCLAPGLASWEALRLAWGAMTRIVDGAGAKLMFGCASFPGADWRPHAPALSLLATGHLGPEGLRPGVRAAETLAYPALVGPVTDRRAALLALPPLLRSYLAMGGWVSDHAVVDRQLDTLHVLTCVPVGTVPAARAASLRGIAATG